MPAPKPNFKNYDHVKEQKREETWLKKLAKRCQQANKGEYVGQIVTYPRGDGYAQYMICSEKPFVLIHLPVGDNWRADAVWERGVRLADVKHTAFPVGGTRKGALFGRS